VLGRWDHFVLTSKRMGGWRSSVHQDSCLSVLCLTAATELHTSVPRGLCLMTDEQGARWVLPPWPNSKLTTGHEVFHAYLRACVLAMHGHDSRHLVTSFRPPLLTQSLIAVQILCCAAHLSLTLHVRGIRPFASINPGSARLLRVPPSSDTL